MEEVNEPDLGTTELIDLSSSEADQKQLEFQRALEVISQNLVILIDECFLSFPTIPEASILKTIEETNKFLSLHQAHEDQELLDYIGKGMQVILHDYKWKESIKQ
jgi:hypothetical protein